MWRQLVTLCAPHVRQSPLHPGPTGRRDSTTLGGNNVHVRHKSLRGDCYTPRQTGRRDSTLPQQVTFLASSPEPPIIITPRRREFHKPNEPPAGSFLPLKLISPDPGGGSTFANELSRELQARKALCLNQASLFHNGGDGLANQVLQWFPEGRRRRGRPKMNWRQTVERDLQADLRELEGSLEAGCRQRKLGCFDCLMRHETREPLSLSKSKETG
ncbi:hypothetical protein Bbelb_228710 [Branchiostoma belcheri]|nr:hypothetical protein Bbelb_228710 [Branchiostoma belcheri]